VHAFLITLHVILSLLLVFVILMQPGKGADPSSAFGGGGGSQLFGASGPGNLLTRGTGVIATLFMVTSVTLAYQSTRENERDAGGVDEGLKKTEGEGEEGAGFGVTPGGEKPTIDAPTDAPADGTAPAAPADGAAAPVDAPAAPAEGATAPATPAPAPTTP